MIAFYLSFLTTNRLLFHVTGDQVYAPLRPGEHPSPGIEQVRQAYALPTFVKNLLAYLLPAPDAALLRGFHRQTIVGERELIAEREEWRRIWLERWMDEELDFVLCPTAAVPQLPKGGTAVSGLTLATYTMLFNIVSLLVVASCDTQYDLITGCTLARSSGGMPPYHHCSK